MDNVKQYIQILWDYLKREDELTQADVIIGFGSNDITIAERAIDLFEKDYAPYLLFSGGLGKGTEGVWTRSEADTFHDIAVKRGVADDKVLVENKSTNTGENIRFTKELLEKEGIAVQTAIIVHQPNMGRRIYAALRKQWPKLNPIIAPSKCSLDQYLEKLEKNGVDEEDIFSNIVGDFQRIDLFAKQGYQIPQDIPNEAMDAFEKLCELGYTRYVI